MIMTSPSVRFVADASVLIEWPGPPSLEVNARVLRLFRLFSEASPDWGIENLHPGYSSLLIDFTRKAPPPAEILAYARELSARPIFGEVTTGDLVHIPARYDGEDLPEVARRVGTSVEEIIRLHSEAEYRVAFLGFAPGFPYLLGLREELHGPRKSVPRLKVPAGSIAIAGFQTGIYPGESPGGWQLLGRTPLEMFDVRRSPACLLKPGDRVRFTPLNEPRARSLRKVEAAEFTGHPLAEVLRPGMFSTLQDHGRIRSAHLGISRGGAADSLALRVGNQILGNGGEAAAVEMTGTGMSVRFLKDSWICLSGSEAAAHIDGKSVPGWTAIQVFAGQVLDVGPIVKMRAYLCVRGGIGGEVLLGSRSTFVNGGWGGYNGRSLRAGDLLCEAALQVEENSYRGRALSLRRIYAEDHGVLHVTRGPQWDFFSDAACRLFFESEYEVSNEVNRLGLRLQGASLEYAEAARGREMLSEGIAAGAVQVPPSGAPMILFCEQTTTGGYPKIANVIQSDQFKLAQLKPGDKIRFKEIEREDAWRRMREFEEALQSMGFVS